MEHNDVKFEVVHVARRNEEVAEIFDTATEATGRFRDLQNEGLKPRFYMVRRTRVFI